MAPDGPPGFGLAGFAGESMTAIQQLKQWQRAHPGRKVYWGRCLVAMADGGRSECATGAGAETAVRAVLNLWHTVKSEAA